MKKYSHHVSDNDIKHIHELSLRILSEIGVRFENEKAIDLFRKYGLQVVDQTVFIDEKTVMNCLKTCPPTIEQYSTKGSVTIGNGSRLNMPACGCVYVSEDNTIRRTENRDIVDLFKLSSTSPLIDYNYMDFFPDTKHFTENQKMYASTAMMLKYSPTTGCYDPDTFRVPPDKLFDETVRSINLIRRFEGVEGTDKYVNTYCVNSLSPLCFDFAPLEKMLAYCSENQPIWITPCAMPALTAPHSVYSTLAMTNAEVLAGIVLSQIAQPGVPIIYGNTSVSTDLRSVILSIGSAETALMIFATVAMADFYNLPCRTGGSLSDAKDSDYQAGAETMMTLNATYEAGADLILHAFGIMGSFNIFSYEKFILDEETARFALRMCQGINTNEENGFFDIIKKVGPRGSFIKVRTPKIYKEDFLLANVFEKHDPNAWHVNGDIPISKVAADIARKRIDSFQPPEITKEQNELLDEFIPIEYKERI